MTTHALYVLLQEHENGSIFEQLSQLTSEDDLKESGVIGLSGVSTEVRKQAFRFAHDYGWKVMELDPLLSKSQKLVTLLKNASFPFTERDTTAVFEFGVVPRFKDWLPAMKGLLEHADIATQPYGLPFSEKTVTYVSQQDWYAGMPPQKGGVCSYASGGFWIIKSALLAQSGFPSDDLPVGEEEAVFGEFLRQTRAVVAREEAYLDFSAYEARLIREQKLSTFGDEGQLRKIEAGGIELTQSPSIYEAIYLDGELAVPGMRDPKLRYEMIKPHLYDGLWLDIGANFGEFSRFISADFPRSVCVSVERHPGVIAVQQQLLEYHARQNVVAVKALVTQDLLREWLEGLPYIDGVLVLSVLHHFPPDYAHTLLSMICEHVPNVFIELPNPDDRRAFNKEGFMRFFPYEKTFSEFGEVTKLGVTPSHTSLPREIYVIKNRSLERKGRDTIAATNAPIHTYRYDGDARTWFRDGVPVHQIGISIPNLLELRRVYPSDDSLVEMVEKLYDSDTSWGVSRKRPVFFTAQGLQWGDPDSADLDDSQTEIGQDL